MSPRRSHPARVARVLTGGIAVAATAAVVALLAAQGRSTADAASLLQSDGEVVEIRVPAGSDAAVVETAVESWRRDGNVDGLPGVSVRIVESPAHTRSGAS